jgi:hypothetical protein
MDVDITVGSVVKGTTAEVRRDWKGVNIGKVRVGDFSVVVVISECAVCANMIKERAIGVIAGT